ncbi:MAG: tetratricopeptide repeat protein [Rhodobacteraceae bacterium]|nr:tetratricopeptide repeat protein [Paracoccaceae bacterium]
MSNDWNDARRAYRAGEEGAEQSYMALVEKYPDQADIRGELGNIYIKSGKQQKAAEQFLQAGLSLARAGNTDKAKRVLEILRNLDPARAEQLRVALEG